MLASIHRHSLRAAALGVLLMLVASLTAQAECAADPEDIDAIADAIAVHALAGHGDEFAFDNAPALAVALANIMRSTPDHKALRDQRWAYWDAGTGIIVIYNARARDCGTAFVPTAGKAYYDRQQ